MSTAKLIAILIATATSLTFLGGIVQVIQGLVTVDPKWRRKLVLWGIPFVVFALAFGWAVYASSFPSVPSVPASKNATPSDSPPGITAASTGVLSPTPPSVSFKVLPEHVNIPCISCPAGYSLGVVLNTIELDSTQQQTKLNFTLTNDAGSACNSNTLYDIELENTSSGQTARGQGTAGQDWPLGSGQSVPVFTLFSLTPQPGSAYRLTIAAQVCGTYENYQTEILTFPS